MRKKISLALILATLLLFSTGNSQEKEVKETVSVVNVEIPVRVFYKKKMVDNLKKENFTLIVNGRTREITGFNIVKKQIDVQDIELKEKDPEYAPRYFILALNITNYSEDIKKGINHILEKILRPNDAMLVFINNKTKLFRDMRDRESVRNSLDELISVESLEARKRMTLYFTQLEKEI